jgi:ABC-type uncharacterized transport system involved in gliding motility auxiliary subunit
MRQNLYQYAPAFPWAGLLLLAAGFVVYLITRRLEPATNLLLGGGALLLLLFAVIRPDDVRLLLNQRQTRYGSSTLLSILFFTAIMVLLYWIAYQNSQWRWDATETGEFTPLPETISVLRDLDEPVHVIAFYPPSMGFQEQRARTLLDSLAAVSNRFTYEFVDPELDPLRAQQYELNFPGTLVFTKGNDFAKANSLTDQEIHTALIKVINPVAKTAYFLTGHGELDINDFDVMGLNTAVRLIRDLGFTMEELNLFIQGSVPADATVLVIIAPRSPFSPGEVRAIGDYLNRGGALFLARGSTIVDNQPLLSDEQNGLYAMLQDEWGIQLRQDVVIDQDFAQAGQRLDIAFLGADYGFSPIVTEDLRRYGTRFAFVRSIAFEPADNVTQTELVRTSGAAWGETDLALFLEQGYAEPDPEDAIGPLTIGLSAENFATEARIVIFGDNTFMTNQGILANGNSFLFTNAMNWLAEDEVAIDLTPRATVDRQIVIQQTQLNFLLLVSSCLGPLLALVAGTAVWYSRRQNR